MKLTISLILLFILSWLTGVICWFSILISSMRIKRIIRKDYPQIRYEFGFNNQGKSTYRISRVKRELVKMFFAFGSKRSVKSYLRVFMDLDAIYVTKSFMLVPRINRMIDTLRVSVIAFWCLIFIVVFMWVFLV